MYIGSLVLISYAFIFFQFRLACSPPLTSPLDMGFFTLLTATFITLFAFVPNIIHIATIQFSFLFFWTPVHITYDTMWSVTGSTSNQFILFLFLFYSLSHVELVVSCCLILHINTHMSGLVKSQATVAHLSLQLFLCAFQL